MSRLSWNEIRVRAQIFADEWKDAKYERGETQTFYNEFFEIFGISRKRVASYEEPVKKLGDKQGFIDLFWKGVLIVEQKSAGRNLANAREQAFGYFPGLKEYELPRFLLACDFQNFELYDLIDDEEVRFKLADLPKHIEKFAFILGVQKRTFKDQDPVNIKASVLMGRLHDELYQSGYRGHDLERFLVRLLFCLFADDTGIFEPRDMFDELIRARTKEDGSDVGPILSLLFQTLDTDENDRETALDEDIARFPYINGDLFKENLRLPSFNSKMRSLLLEACEFSWDAISPAIFGALFQHVSGDAAARRAHGEHYTTENHILRLIGPLFLDELTDELDGILQKRGEAKKKGVVQFVDKLAALRFLDPACGCGNFLVIAYREIRMLEIRALDDLYKDSSGVMGAVLSSKVSVEQFYGIEINEFPARIAEVALWMMDHILNLEWSLRLGKDFRRIPILDKPHILHADALEVDWRSLLSSSKCRYVFGNPPFLGAKVQSVKQREQVRRIAALGRSGGTLDFVCAWYFKAAEYVQGTDARIAFVSTNSISQGEQVAQLWPSLFNRFKLEIIFAHRTFEWSSDAVGRAHVHVVIVGLSAIQHAPKLKRLYSYADIRGDAVESLVGSISPYLFDGSRLSNSRTIVEERPRPINGLPRAVIGSKPIDNGELILSPIVAKRMTAEFPALAPYVRPLLGSKEFIQGESRFILVLHECPPSVTRSVPEVMAKLSAITKFRRESKSAATRALADTPASFHVTVVPKEVFLVLPQTSSEGREYMPVGFAAPPSVPTNAVKVVLGAGLWEFGLLTSRMHMSWMRAITGRLNSRYQYSIGVVYNNYPCPVATAKDKGQIEKLAQGVLDARAVHSTSSLADLYDSLAMPANLRKAHQALDTAVDKLYRPSGFSSDAERVEHLFGLYERMTSLFSEDKPARKTRRKKAE